MKMTVERFKRMSRRDQRRFILKEDVKLARQLLNKRIPSKDDFEKALFWLRDDPKLQQWKPRIEKCFARLSKADRGKLRKEMFRFYLRSRDFENAERFVPGEPRQWVEVPSEMEVYLRLKRFSKARMLADFCEANLHPDKRFMYENWLRLPLAVYYAHLEDYQKALEHLSLMDARESSYWVAAPYQAEFECAIALKTARQRLKTAESILSTITPPLLSRCKDLTGARRRLRRLIPRLESVFSIKDKIGKARAL